MDRCIDYTYHLIGLLQQLLLCLVFLPYSFFGLGLLEDLNMLNSALDSDKSQIHRVYKAFGSEPFLKASFSYAFYVLKGCILSN